MRGVLSATALVRHCCNSVRVKLFTLFGGGIRNVEAGLRRLLGSLCAERFSISRSATATLQLGAMGCGVVREPCLEGVKHMRNSGRVLVLQMPRRRDTRRPNPPARPINSAHHICCSLSISLDIIAVGYLGGPTNVAVSLPWSCDRFPEWPRTR